MHVGVQDLILDSCHPPPNTPHLSFLLLEFECVTGY